MEGLCGNCNGDEFDELTPRPSKKILESESTELTQKQKVDNFVWSWLADEPLLFEKEKECFIDRTPPCLDLDEDTDPCFDLLNNPAFKKVRFFYFMN